MNELKARIKQNESDIELMMGHILQLQNEVLTLKENKESVKKFMENL